MLMNHKAEMTFEDLKDLILENETTNFDPVAEAFKVSKQLYIHIIKKECSLHQSHQYLEYLPRLTFGH